MNYIEILAITISFSTFLGGIITWYRGAVEKRYAAERDFNHLMLNYEELNSNIFQIAKNHEEKLEEIQKELIEVKNLVNIVAFKVFGENASLKEICLKNFGVENAP